MHKNILIGVLLTVFIVQVYAIASLAPDEPQEQCVPLYDSGMECCK